MQKKSFPLRIDERIFDRLKAWADDEFRSVNGQIEFALREALRREGRWKDLPAGGTGSDAEVPEIDELDGSGTA